MAANDNRHLITVADPAALAATAAEHVLARTAANSGRVAICLTGGSTPKQLYQLLWRGNFVCCPSVLFRTDALRAAGGFDARWHYALDWELWFRLLRASHSFATVTRPLLRYRRHDAAASRARTRDLSRFREEVEVLAQARELGVAAGLLDAGARSTAVRNNALHEACDDLHRGDRAAAAAKIAFVRALPGFSRDPWLCAFAAMARLGAPGRTALTAGRALAVRLGLGG